MNYAEAVEAIKKSEALKEKFSKYKKWMAAKDIKTLDEAEEAVSWLIQNFGKINE